MIYLYISFVREAKLRLRFGLPSKLFDKLVLLAFHDATSLAVVTTICDTVRNKKYLHVDS